MPQWLHRTDKTLLNSIAAADLPEAQANYIEEPDLSAVTGWPAIYWTITGDTVTLQSQAERDATDAAIAAALLVVDRATNVTAVDSIDSDGMRIRALIQTFNRRDNYLVNRIEQLQDVVMAMLNSTGAVGNMRADGLALTPMLATNTRTLGDARQDYKDDINAGLVDN